jgi:AcrR family transcriptional regulator
MGRRNHHSRDQQRAMALEAAEALIDDAGMAGMSMRQVARAMGYSAGNLYLLYRNQDELLAAIADRTADMLLEHLRRCAADAPAAQLQLKAIACGCVEFAGINANRWRLLFERAQSTPEWDRPEPAMTRRSVEPELYALFREQLRALVPAGTAQAADAAALALWSSIHGLCVLAVNDGLSWSGHTDYRPLAELIVQSFVRGLGGTPALPRPPADA